MTICLLGDEPPKTHAVVQHEQIKRQGQFMSFAYKSHAGRQRRHADSLIPPYAAVNRGLFQPRRHHEKFQ